VTEELYEVSRLIERKAAVRGRKKAGEVHQLTAAGR
jgi:hypothetical protein